ncbi:MAG: hypothetical protein ABW278_13730 [Steroidobacteraceae bacterium]
MWLLAGITISVWAAAPAPREDNLDEAVITATRARLSSMRQEMARLEDRFYDRYNQLNAENDFDVHCAQETRAGTRLQARHCRPVYEAAAMAEEGSDYHRFLQACCDTSKPGPSTAGSYEPPLPALVKIEARRPEFRKTMLQVTSSNPELLGLLKERSRMAKRYEATRRKVFGRKPLPDDDPPASPMPPSR